MVQIYPGPNAGGDGSTTQEAAEALNLFNVVEYGALEGSSNNATTAFTDAVTAALAAAIGANGLACVYVPEGDWYTNLLTVSNQVRWIGAGSGATRVFHRDAQATKFFDITGDETAPDATPYGGFTGMTLVGGSATTDAVLYYRGNIDNQVKFDDVTFACSASNTACDGISVKDYLNWHVNRARFDAIPGWALRVRGAASTDFQGSQATFRDVTWDCGSGGNGKGLLLADFTNVSDNNRGGILFDGFTIEVNGALNQTVPAKAVIRILQNTTYVDAKGPQVSLTLRDGHAKVNSGSDAIKNCKLIGTDYKDLGLVMENVTVNQFAEVYNNDAGNARYGLTGRRSEPTYYPFYSTAPDPAWEPTRKSKSVFAGIGLSSSNVDTLTNGFFNPGDIILRRAPSGSTGKRTFATMAVQQTEGQAFASASVLTTGDISSGTALLTLAAVTNDAINPGSAITVAGAGVASADLNTRILSINYSTKVATLANNASSTVSGANVSTLAADFRYVEMVGYGTSAPASGAWAKGDWAKNTDPDLGEAAAWANTVAGSPGTHQPIAFVETLASHFDRIINVVIDGGGAEIADGVKFDIQIPYACTITGWDLVADQSGSIVIDVWKDTYGNFPPTVADTIAGSEKPTLSSAVTNQDLALSTWTTALAANNWLRFNVDSATTVTRVTLAIRVRRTGA